MTSADVAQASGVSRATVSYVLNDDPHQSIPPETRERVHKAAQMLGYHPFTPARILRTGQSQLVLAVLPFEQIDPALARNLKALEARLAAHGLTLLCSFGQHLRTKTTHPSFNVTPTVILSYADEADPTIAAFLAPFHVPIFSMMSPETLQQAVGRMQASYLLEHGKRQLFFIASQREDVHFLMHNRLLGVRQACAQWALESPSVCIIPSSREDGRLVLRDLLAGCAPPWGICCYNDEVAFAVIAALTDEGIAIPEGAAVIGCDDIPLAPFCIPSLTTIHFDTERTLDPLVEMIMATAHGESVNEVPQMVISVIERKSA
ncbi:LacI family transcriptional regulator [Ktedonobacteria bacterium brp13]|nr:LacI family transcriptional regulator [Ktedonobacteria bacterium brp13]